MAIESVGVKTGVDAQIAADSIGGLYYQVAKLAFGVDGTATLISAADPMPVVGKSAVLDFVLSLDTSAYASGDVLADTQALTSAFRVADGTGMAYSLVLNDKDDQKQALDLYFLSANVAMGTENAAPSITDANADNILGYVPVLTSDWQDLGGASIAFIPANRLGVGLKAASGTTTLYLAAICRSGTPTYTAAGITGRLTVIQD